MSAGATFLERPPSGYYDHSGDFEVLRNTCLRRSSSLSTEPYELLWFAPTEGDEEAVENDQASLEGRRNCSACGRLHEAWLYTAYNGDADKDGVGPALLEVTHRTLRGTGFDELAVANASSWRNGTTLVAQPHLPDNNFHLHNDLILPLVFKLMHSSTNRSGGLAATDSDRPLRLLLTHGSRRNYEKRAIAFDTLYDLFDEVDYSIEDRLTHGRTLCFSRLVWGNNMFRRPYYGEYGRFGNSFEWEGIVPAFRDRLFGQHGIVAAPPSKGAPPRLTWVDRPCNKFQGDSRCLHDPEALLEAFQASFDVKVLTFDRNQRRKEQLLSMLETLASTDVLVGMHGAGLGHIAYLPDLAMVVEIQGAVMREKKLFLNMASKQDVPYYMFDAGDAAGSAGIRLTTDQRSLFAKDLAEAWSLETKRRQIQPEEPPNDHPSSASAPENRCLFPRYQNGVHLSSHNTSRCYLELAPGTKEDWRQCVHYNECGGGPAMAGPSNTA